MPPPAPTPTPTLALTPLPRPPDATVVVPGSKSHTNRALVCAALADGTSELRGALAADDTAAMVGALRALDVAVEVDAEGQRLVVRGTGGRLPVGPRSVEVRQSGTTGRFVLPLLALGPGPYRLDGDEQLRRRPFGPLTTALRRLGARIEGDELPLTVHGGVRGGRASLSGSVSSQFLSALVLTGPALPGGLVVELTDELVSKPYLDLTVATLAQFGVTARVDDDRRRVEVPASALRPGVIDLEPDASAASYFFAAAAVTGGRVRVDGLGTRTVQGDLRFVDVLEQMGATVRRGPDWTEVTGDGPLHGVDVDLADFSDTAQTLAVTATFATTPTRITGIGFIRRKETDRIGAVVRELSRLGIRAVEEPDGMVVHPGAPSPGVVATYDDHRMAMSFALLGLAHPGIVIADPACVGKTFPRFWQVLDGLGPERPR